MLLSGKLFRLEIVWSNSINLLNYPISLSSVIWFIFFSRWRFYLLPLSASGGRMKGEQCSLLYRSRHFHTWTRIPSNTRVHLDVYPLLLGMSVTSSLFGPTGSNPAWQCPLEIFGPSSDQPSWLKLPLTYYWLIVNFHLNYCSLPSTSLSSELRNSRTAKRKHDDFILALDSWVYHHTWEILKIEMHCDMKRNYLYSKLLQ